MRMGIGSPCSAYTYYLLCLYGSAGADFSLFCFVFVCIFVCWWPDCCVVAERGHNDAVHSVCYTLCTVLCVYFNSDQVNVKTRAHITDHRKNIFTGKTLIAYTVATFNFSCLSDGVPIRCGKFRMLRQHTHYHYSLSVISTNLFN